MTKVMNKKLKDQRTTQVNQRTSQVNQEQDQDSRRKPRIKNQDPRFKTRHYLYVQLYGNCSFGRLG